MKKMLLALLLFAQPAFAGDDRYDRRDRDRDRDHRKYEREYEYEYKERGKYHCHYRRGEEYCHRHRYHREEHRQKQTCIWIQRDRVGFWVCEEKKKDWRSY